MPEKTSRPRHTLGNPLKTALETFVSTMNQ